MTPGSALECPSCGAEIPTAGIDFFPTRKLLVVCKACGQASRLPYKAIAGGMLTLLVVMGAEMLVAKALGAHRPFTLPGLLAAAAVGAFILVSSLWAARLVCRNLVTHLDPDPAFPPRT